MTDELQIDYTELQKTVEQLLPGNFPITFEELVNCTSQQKVDTFFIFYTAVKGHNTPYTVLASDSLKNTQGVLH